MPSPVNRQRRKKAFTRGYSRPQLFNPYKNPVLDGLWKRGKEERLKKTGGVMPPLPPKRTRQRPQPTRGFQANRPQGGRMPSNGNRLRP